MNSLTNMSSYNPNNDGYLELITGNMRSGKSTRRLEIKRKYEIFEEEKNNSSKT